MKIILCEDYDEMSDKAAQIVSEQILKKPESILGLATGNTPVGMYTRLVQMYREGKIDFSAVKSFNLDEYYPIKRENANSYHRFMQEHLFSKINIKPENTNIPDGETIDSDRECVAYDEKIKESGGIDFQILGMGQNGHIGFNEPGEQLEPAVHKTRLAMSTRKANAKFFKSEKEVPEFALTMGMASIMQAKKILILASGADKSDAVSALLSGKINTMFPVTMLNVHPDVTLVCDKTAFSAGMRLGVDIGGTNIKFAVIGNHKVKYENTIKTADTGEGIVSDIIEEYKQISGKFPVKRMGIGSAGGIADGVVSAANLPFKNFPLETELKKHIEIPINIENDANCAALAEWHFGEDSECADLVLLTLGTGIGGGIIIHRRLYKGSHGAGGEMGHMIVQSENGRACPCGQNGCFERYASSSALLRDAITACVKNPDSVLYKIYSQNGNQLSGEDIFAALDAKCDTAEDVFDNYIKYLAGGIDSIARIFNPDVIVLAGGITRQGDRLLKPLKDKMHRNINIKISELQSGAGALGAALL